MGRRGPDMEDKAGAFSPQHFPPRIIIIKDNKTQGPVQSSAFVTCDQKVDLIITMVTKNPEQLLVLDQKHGRAFVVVTSFFASFSPIIYDSTVSVIQSCLTLL